jgi:cysteinyl-tRNA synthetase
MIRSREEARKVGNWEIADSLRKKLLEMGIEVSDTKQGTVWNRVDLPQRRRGAENERK